MVKICIANCSEECLNNKKNRCFRYNNTNYNMCKNDECNVFVCKACSIELNNHDMTHCIVNCNIEEANNLLEENLDNLESNDIDNQEPKKICCNCNINIINTIYPENYTSECDNLISIRMRCCIRQFSILAMIIIVPICLILLLVTIQTKGSIFKEDMPNSFSDIVCLLGLMWCFGMIVIVIAMCLINCCKGDLHC